MFDNFPFPNWTFVTSIFKWKKLPTNDAKSLARLIISKNDEKKNPFF